MDMEMDLGIDELKQELKTKKLARGTYLWSRLLSIVSVPWFLILLIDTYHPSFFGYLGAAVFPAIPYLFFIGLYMTSNILFVRKHAQQALILVGLRMIFAFLVAWFTWNGAEGFAVLLFFAGNGGLWWFGNRWGLGQVERGQCWLMEKRGQGELLNLSDHDIKALTKYIAAYPEMQKKKKEEQASAKPVVLVNETGFIIEAQRALDAGEQAQAVALFTKAFRQGDQVARKEASRALDALGLVEVF